MIVPETVREILAFPHSKIRVGFTVIKRINLTICVLRFARLEEQEAKYYRLEEEDAAITQFIDWVSDEERRQ